MTIVCVAIYVDGIVQGVGFRYFTTQKALDLDLTGKVRNLEDGRVEIIACGKPQAVDQLLEWLKQGGPKSARIIHVVTKPCPLRDYDKFYISD